MLLLRTRLALRGLHEPGGLARNKDIRGKRWSCWVKTPCAEGGSAEHLPPRPWEGARQLHPGVRRVSFRNHSGSLKKHRRMKSETKPWHCSSASTSQTVLSCLLVCTLSWEAIDGVQKMLFPWRMSPEKSLPLPLKCEKDPVQVVFLLLFNYHFFFAVCNNPFEAWSEIPVSWLKFVFLHHPGRFNFQAILNWEAVGTPFREARKKTNTG